LIDAADEATTTGPFPFLHEGTLGVVAGAVLFAALAVIVSRMARRKLE
jgi:hypothetical protein